MVRLRVRVRPGLDQINLEAEGPDDQKKDERSLKRGRGKGKGKGKDRSRSGSGSKSGSGSR